MPVLTTSDGIQIHYELRGEGTPLLLVMGLGADGSVWADHVAEYEKHFQCVLIDNRGVGLSDKPPGPYTSARMAQDVAEVADALGIQKAHSAGISMGGIIVQELALLRPELLLSAVIISSWAQLNAYAVRVFEHMKPARAHMRPEDFMDLIQLWIFTSPYYEANGAQLAEGRADAGSNSTPQPQHGFEGQADACIQHDCLERLGQITTRTLIVAGEDDIFTPLAFSEQLARGIPNAELVTWPGAGHAVHWEVLEEFNARSRDFLLSNNI
ncbi:MAG: pimeloyl-ACP methyl ester carboxylesterase [Planctomycetota bacterium]|jgi:pimeloyl-ACP methyl ester carboxylesterase